MKRVLSITLLFILVPSFFMFIIYKEEDKIISEVITKHITKKNKNEFFIKVKQTSKNKIIKVDLEEYVKGVIAGEMPVSFNIEALKAQAVAARTYGVKRINEKNTYDVVDTVMNQVYLDDDTLKIRWKTYYSIYKEKINKAVEETKGEYVDYNGTYADTLFFSTSTGYTENSEEIFGNKVAYLRSVSSYWDEEESPVYEETTTFTREEFCKHLNMTDCSKIYINVLNETSTGRIKKLTINNKTFTGTEVAYLLGVRSNYFNVKIVNNKVEVTTKGFGHGVGMSQYGANGMANNGYTYKEILEHYYQGTTIKKLY